MDTASPPTSNDAEMDASARRELLKRLLEDASDESLVKFHKKLCDRRPSICVARATPKKDWIPKHKKATLDAIVLLKNGAGIRKAPFERVPDSVNYKVVTSELAEALMYLNEEKTSSEKQRSETITISMCVASLLARLAEEANDLSDLAEEEAESGGVIICEKVDRKHAPVWAQMSAKGSGLSCNERGMQRLKSVVLQMHDRLAEDSASVSGGSGEEEAVGDE